MPSIRSWAAVAAVTLSLASCKKSTEPVEAAVAAEAPAAVAAVDRTQQPAPLPPRPFNLPQAEEARLSNGVPVVLVRNTELPLVSVRVEWDVGSFLDPKGKEGLAGATLDMMNEGAGSYDALTLSAALRRLATDLGSGAGLDSSSVSMGALKRNLEPSLDLLADVVLRPTFPKEDWERLQKQYLQDLDGRRKDPSSTAGAVAAKVFFGAGYGGAITTEKSVKDLSVKAMKAWHAANLGPTKAVILVGGDITLEELLPLLEARFGGWKGGTAAPTPAPAPVVPRETTLTVIDFPGAAQSVIIGGTFVGNRTDPDRDALELANLAWGGEFTARLNMNLREDKGYTYGARSFFRDNHAGARWMWSASVKTDTTRASLEEVFKELEQVEGDRPLSAEEIEAARSGAILGYPNRFETAGYLLDMTSEIRRYGLPADTLSTYVARMKAVDAAAAQAAFADKVVGRPMHLVVAGDLSVIGKDLESLGLPIAKVDVDGNPVR